MLTWHAHAILIVGLFAIGTVVGSFLNVCIYRIPWQKSVIWPASHCPKCFAAIAPQDNIPVVSWIALRGECRRCGLPISSRYPLIEALVGLLFAGVYVSTVVYGAEIPWGPLPTTIPVGLAYFLSLVALLVAATFIDYDLTIIPDQVTVPGMVIGIGVGTLFPAIRPAPGHAVSHWDGFWVGVIGLLVGGGLTQSVRLIGSLALRREAMGFGDVTLMAMIGAYLGWQAAVLTFFIAPFFGLSHAVAKLVIYIGKRLKGGKSSSADREIPFGPYLSMAAIGLLLSWPWFWPSWAKSRFEILPLLFSSEWHPHDIPLQASQAVDRAELLGVPTGRRSGRGAGLDALVHLGEPCARVGVVPVRAGDAGQHHRPGDLAERAGRIGDNGRDDDTRFRLAKDANRRPSKGRR